MDDLLSLDWDKPSKQQHQPTQPQPSNRPPPPSTSTSKPSSYSFDVLTKNLARSGTASPNYYNSAASQSSNANVNVPAKGNVKGGGGGGGDAFSSLFASSTSTPAQQQSMTLAERQKLAASQPSRSSNSTAAAVDWSSATDWGLLDTSTSSSSAAVGMGKPTLGKPIAPTTSSKPSSTAAAKDPFDFSTLTSSSSRPSTSKPIPQPVAQATKKPSVPAVAAAPVDPFDFSAFEKSGSDEGGALGGTDMGRTSLGNDEDDDQDPFAAFNAPPQPKASQKSTSGASFDWDDDGDREGLEDRIGGIRLGDDDDGEISGLTGSGNASARPVHRPRPGSDDFDDFGAAKPASGRSRKTGTDGRGPDPPPHILGKVVEMGFGLAEARESLLSTRDVVGNWNVSAALERLVDGGGGGTGPAPAPGPGSGRGGRGTPQPRTGRGQEDMEERDRKLAMRLQRQEQEAIRSQSSRGNTSRRNGLGENEGESTSSTDWQRQAEELVTQASEIGSTVLSRAGAFWNQAKAQAQKALEERTGENRGASGRNSPASNSNSMGGGGAEGYASNATTRARPSRWAVPGRENAGKNGNKDWSGKPRWMVDAERAAEVGGGGDSSIDTPLTPFADSVSASQPTSATATSFKDSDEEGKMHQQGRLGKKTSSAAVDQSNPQRDLWDTPVESKSPSSRPTTTTTTSKDHLSAPSRAQGSGYVSPGRRGTPISSSAAISSSSSATRPPPSRSIRKLHRQHPTESASSLSKSHASKEVGNAHFLKGAYGEAEKEYGVAMRSLSTDPPSLLLVPLLNNRAQTRLRNGDAKGAVEDCEEAVKIILGGGADGEIYDPEAEQEMPKMYAQVDLRGGFAKAMSRKAQGLEMMEKWAEARRSWERLERFEKEVGSGGGKGSMGYLRSAREGCKRCEMGLRDGRTRADTKTTTMTTTGATTMRNARDGGSKGEAPPRPSAATRAVIAKAGQAGIARVRAEQATLEAEEAERLRLKDSVDAKIQAWKGGKEKNLRALLASVENVAWEGLGWKKVGMHQLVTDKQVKMAYTRAIGKLHPDKLTPKTTSVEERMIGTAVFSSLNDAWVAQS